jgi:hypothetical protein
MSYSGQMAAGAKVGRAILGRSVKPYLEPDEELLAAMRVRRASGVTKWLWACLEITPPAPEVPKKLAVAATGRRLLFLEVRGALVDEAKGLLWEVPISEVDAVEKNGGFNMSQVSWRAGGRRYTLWGNGGHVDRFADALSGGSGSSST